MGNAELNTVKVPRADIVRDVKEPEILASFEATLEELRLHGATVVDNVQYSTWTPDFSRRTLPFVWSQLKTCERPHPRLCS